MIAGNETGRSVLSTDPAQKRTFILDSTRFKDWFSNGFWAIDYRLEESRQAFSDRRQLWQQAAICVVIGILNLAR
jgi:hypothetical protein